MLNQVFTRTDILQQNPLKMYFGKLTFTWKKMIFHNSDHIHLLQKKHQKATKTKQEKKTAGG